MKYADQLKDPRWQKRRLEVLNSWAFGCKNCNRTDLQLHVHHSYYEKGLMLWEYPDDALHCLCHQCHLVRAEVESALLRAVYSLSNDRLFLLAEILQNIGDRGLWGGDVLKGLSDVANEIDEAMKEDFNQAHSLPAEIDKPHRRLTQEEGKALLERMRVAWELTPASATK